MSETCIFSFFSLSCPPNSSPHQRSKYRNALSNFFCMTFFHYNLKPNNTDHLEFESTLVKIYKATFQKIKKVLSVND